jgi:hypothetical protein
MKRTIGSVVNRGPIRGKSVSSASQVRRGSPRNQSEFSLAIPPKK